MGCGMVAAGYGEKVRKAALGVAAAVVVAAVVASYLVRTDAFALIAWIAITFLTAGVLGVIYGLNETVRHLRERRRST